MIPTSRPRPVTQKIFLVVAAGTLLLALSTSARFALALNPGDVNGDGVVNPVDVGLIKNHLMERAPLAGDALSRADANQDGKVDLADAVWAASHTWKPAVAQIAGRIIVPAGTPLDPSGFALVSPGGNTPLNSQWEFSDMPVWNSNAGQFLFVEDLSSSSLLMMYVNPEEISTTQSLELTTTHAATALIAMHPVCFSLDDRQRRELHDIAKTHTDFPTLVQLIDQALMTSPTLLCDYDSFPAIYELAAAIGNAAAQAWQDSQAAPAPPSSIDAGPLGQIGRSQDPHLDDWPSNGMTLVNPHLLFYGVQWGGGATQWTVLRGRDGVIQLIPPGWTPDVEKQVRVANGNYTVDVWKGQGALWSSNSAERAGAQANVFKTVILAVDTLAPPGLNLITGAINNNEMIEYFAMNPSERTNEIIEIWEALNLTGADSVFSVLKKIVHAMVNNGVYEGSLTQKLAQAFYDMTDADGRALWRHFRNANTWIESFLKVLKAYDIANEFAPYSRQVFSYANHYVYGINVENGVLTEGWSQIPPEARLTVSDALPLVGQAVTFDASGSTDDSDPFSQLDFRFDFNADGTWDTSWAQGNAVETKAYSTTGARTCIVEVRDTDNLTAQASCSLYVRSTASGTIAIDVTPDAGQWRLIGPAGFVTLTGTGDRTGGSVIANASAGQYTLSCLDNVSGYNPPGAETKTLAAGGSVSFNPVYSMEGGPADLTITLPGGVPLEFVRVPAGPFQMGRYSGERNSDSDEDPQHTVNIAYNFYMGKYELTQRQWLALMGSWPETAPSSTYGLGDNYPGYYISWDDCQNFITALNAHVSSTGQGPATFRLPSEAEWECAGRAGTQTRFFFGDSLSVDDMDTDGPAGTLPGNRSDYMWFGANNSPNGSKPVGTKLPNQFGLYDMSGNVSEWCQDWYHSSYTGAPTNGSAWESPVGSCRVFRGGNWGSFAAGCRSAGRNILFAPAYRNINLGVRLARTQ